MISVNNLSLYFGGQDIFRNISFMVNRGDKIGLTGKNGAGKSTLLRLLASEQAPNDGSISIQNGIIIGYLTQDLEFEDGRTVLEEAQTAFEYLNDIEQRMNHANRQLTERTDYESKEYLDIISEFNDLEERFRMGGGHDVAGEISQVLIGLGFTQYDFNRQTTEFSGGWRMRIELAKLLLKKPDLLLLDEPTNHLDIESIMWLEKWLGNFSGAVVLVSHDKFFLDASTNRTIEITFSRINDYKASYTKYLNLRKDRIEKQIQAKKNQEKYIEDTTVLINKFRAKKNKAAFAQTLIRKLDKLEIIQVEKEDVSHMQFRFPPAPHSGKMSLVIRDASKSYGDLKVLQNINLEIVRGEKIAFVGKNGEGKSTLAKMIANEIEYFGKIELGYQVSMGYYAQNQAEFLDDSLTVLETIEEVASGVDSIKIRSILGSFLFSNDEVTKKIKVLSGGERARVALCRLLLEPYNLLIMDEPTNHLDITSKELLKKALINYDGSLIIVSHDREFLDELTEKVYEFKNQNIKEYIGDISTFLSSKDLENFKQLESSQKEQKIVKQAKKSDKLSSYERKKKKRSLQNRINKLEKMIEELEQKQRDIDLELSDPEKFKELSHQDGFFEQYEKNKQKKQQLELEWSQAVEELELYS
uniref:Probable ATP-binding protein YbiT n=1 Tax=uncultured Sphingobacteriales bacterium HF0130_33B19 TaxID=710991 RepID=E0XTR4_9SPHI|nr:ATPase components of abc transporters with duplicated ATPase domains [uncultured Sphingobacteriales bacterium HF0130_33B19]